MLLRYVQARSGGVDQTIDKKDGMLDFGSECVEEDCRRLRQRVDSQGRIKIKI